MSFAVTVDGAKGHHSVAAHFQALLEEYNQTQSPAFKIEAIFLGDIALCFAYSGGRAPDGVYWINNNELYLSVPGHVATVDVLLFMPESPILTRDEREAKIGAATAWIKTCSIESAGRECPQPVDHEAFYSRMVQKNSGGNDPIVPYAIHVDSAPPLSDIGMWAETDLPVSHGPNRPKIKVKIASSGLLLMRLIERIKQETMRDEIDLQTRRDDRLRNTLHRDRRSEQVRLLRLLVEGLVVAQSHNVAISERILPTTLSRGLTDPDTLLMHADLYKGKSILNNQLASDEARWQMKIEGREHDLARLQQLGRKNLASFRFVRRWLKLTAFMPIIEQAIFVQRRKRAARDSGNPYIPRPRYT